MKAAKHYKVHEGAIIETPTGLTIAKLNDNREAKIKANFLNGGNAFNGFTPPFFLETWNPPLAF
jgi:hypothetical protein